jgi:hypothetical protein
MTGGGVADSTALIGRNEEVMRLITLLNAASRVFMLAGATSTPQSALHGSSVDSGALIENAAPVATTPMIMAG